MRRLARAAGALQAAGPGAEARAAATHAPALVHPPQQSVRPGALPSDRSHTDKWLQAPSRSPQEWVASMTPIEVKMGSVARCYGGTEPALGHPMEIIVLNDTSVEHPAVCKYCGARYFGAHHH